MVSDDEIRALAGEVLPSVEILRVQPGDVIVVSMPGGISMEGANVVVERLQYVWPHNEVAFLGQDATMHVIRGDRGRGAES